MDVASNETLLSMDLASNESLLSIALSPNETLLSMELAPNETLLSMDVAPSSCCTSSRSSSCWHGCCLFIHVPTALAQGMMIAWQRNATKLSSIVAWARGLRTSTHSSCRKWRQSGGCQLSLMRRDPPPVLPPICR